MYKDSKTILFKAITPIHAGVGTEIGLIDMPIQREKSSQIPKIEGSTIKGCMRYAYSIKNNLKNEELLFGSNDGDKGGVIGFTDARLLLYPIISVKKMFAYITCPYILKRYIEDKCIFNNTTTDLEKIKNLNKITVNNGHYILLSQSESGEKSNKEDVVLDVYKFKPSKKEEPLKNEIQCIISKLSNLCEKDKDIYMISDEDFKELILLNREIVTRNKIDRETGVVKKGHLFTEEYLPAESIMYTFQFQNNIFSKEKDKNNIEQLLSAYKVPTVLQIGGDATIGKGIVKTLVVSKEENNTDE